MADNVRARCVPTRVAEPLPTRWDVAEHDALGILHPAIFTGVFSGPTFIKLDPILVSSSLLKVQPSHPGGNNVASWESLRRRRRGVGGINIGQIGCRIGVDGGGGGGR